MTPYIQIDYKCFDQLISQLQNCGYVDEAQKLDSLLHHVAWTSGSELIGELGLEITAFQRANVAIDQELKVTLDRCMEMVRRVWPDIK